MSYTPFPVGTIRGPFSCGFGDFINGHNKGVQFCVQTSNGWAYFIRKWTEEAKCRKEAEKFVESLDKSKI